MNIKKAISGIIAALVLIGGVSFFSSNPVQDYSLTASAAYYTEGEYGNLRYKMYSDHIEISRCNESAVKVVIPAELDGLPVTEIGSFVFKDCVNLTSVTIPKGVTSIDTQSFIGCTGLKSITIPDGVTTIGYSAFEGCTNLTDIIIPDSVIRIGRDTFKDTAWYNAQPDGLVYIGKCLYKYKGKMLENYSAVIRTGTLGIAENAFYYEKNLIDVSIPDSIVNIGVNSFCSCEGLTKIVIPDNGVTIELNAFNSCSNLIDVTIPDSATIHSSILDNTAWYASQPDGLVYLGKWVIGCKGEMENGCTLIIDENVQEIAPGAFSACSENITGIVIPDGITSIPNSAFIYSKGLTNITIPESVEIIGNGAFAVCKGLTDINIPDNVRIIGEMAFCDCTSLTGITIPYGVTAIEELTFSGCIRLKNATIPNSVKYIGKGAFGNCTNLNNVSIPKSVTIIDRDAFSGCANMTEIIVPENVTKIGCYAFSGCTRLKNITILNPDCTIYDLKSTISNGDGVSISYGYGGTIKGYENSTAQAYAEKYGYKFEAIKESEIPETILGDANDDGKVTVADAVMLQKWLLSAGDLNNWQNADICEDGKIDVFDMIEMRKLLIQNK